MDNDIEKADNFRAAYSRFEIDKIASYDESDRAPLLSDPGVIRNRLKVNAAIENARRIQGLRNEYGSFKGWLDSYHPQTLEHWVKLFKHNFVFTGGEIINEFLMSTGYLPGAHTPDCPIYQVVIAKRLPWHSQ